MNLVKKSVLSVLNGLPCRRAATVSIYNWTVTQHNHVHNNSRAPQDKREVIWGVGFLPRSLETACAKNESRARRLASVLSRP
jgi:hypothetical protein